MTSGLLDNALRQQELTELGYTIIDGVNSDDDAAAVLRPYGELIAQYDGAIRYQVKAVPGYEKFRFSKSVNTILVHSEAPGWTPPPRYLALHCRTQATCGGGHTDLADARAFIAALPRDVRQALYERPLHWPGHNTSGGGSAGVHAPIVERTSGGQEIVRFSYNLLTRGHYDPPVDGEADPDSLPLGAFGAELAALAERFFADERTSILIPEGSVLIWDNQRMLHARSAYRDTRRHLTRYWLAERP